MNERTLGALEIGLLLDLLARHVQTPLGRSCALGLRPALDPSRIEAAQDLTTECADYLRAGERFGFSGIEDPVEILARLQIEETSLDPKQILSIEHLISVGMGLRDQFREQENRQRYPRLASLALSIPDLRRLLSGIRGKVLPGGEIDDNATPELRSIRREIGEARGRLQRTLESILRKEERAVQDEIVTFRNGRFVIPVRTDARGQIPGVVHGLSSSGQTTFMEPLGVIEQNNELVRLREQEQIEIARILFTITLELRQNLEAIRTVVTAISQADFAQAKGRLSLEFQCVRPKISRDLTLRLDDARHLLLESALRGSGTAVVPVSLELDPDHRVMVVSGPNAGGKTVVLKTIGLISLMSQMGLHVPAREALLPVFGQVFADIGDQQSISANLSTFTAHLRNISEMVHEVSPPALILLDEIGTGTDPEEGSALAVAIVDFFRRQGATTLATTHYNGVKMWAAQTEGVRNASVEFDEVSLRPTYRLILGIAGASAGLEIARRMNIPDAILDHARGRVDPSEAAASDYLKRLKAGVDEQDSLRAALEEERAATVRERSRLDKEFQKRESERQAAFDASMQRVTHEFAAESARLVASLKDRASSERMKKAAANRAAELRRTGDRLARETRGETSPAPERRSPRAGAAGAGCEIKSAGEIEEGDVVRILSIGREGRVESVREGAFSVTIGSLKFRAERDDVEFVRGASQPKSVMQVKATAADLDQPFVPEINVIGLTADEATDRVDKFLDEAFLAGAAAVRIIHGHGKGILRRAVAALLTGHLHVEKFNLAPAEKGGAGATMVELRS